MNKELYELLSSAQIICVIKSTRSMWLEYVQQRQRGRNCSAGFGCPKTVVPEREREREREREMVI